MLVNGPISKRFLRFLFIVPGLYKKEEAKPCLMKYGFKKVIQGGYYAHRVWGVEWPMDILTNSQHKLRGPHRFLHKGSCIAILIKLVRESYSQGDGPIVLRPIGPTTHWSYTTAHWSYNPLVLHPIGPTTHWSYNPLVLHYNPLVLQPIGPTSHWSYNPLVLQPIGPTAHWSYNPLVLQPIGPTTHWSYSQGPV